MNATPTYEQNEKNSALQTLTGIALDLDNDLLRHSGTTMRVKAVSIRFSADGSAFVSVTSTKSRFISNRPIDVE